MDIKEVLKVSTKNREGAPISEYKITNQSSSQQVEPVYYWLLDFMQDARIEVEKITDNFMASAGSGQFAEFGQRATRMQEEAMKINGLINQIIKSIIQIVYDLKEYEIRLDAYDKAKSKDKKEKNQGFLALKQIWLDNVDMKRGNGAIHAMAAKLGYTTLREAFMIANSIEDLEKLRKDEHFLNEQVERILKPRLGEFLLWIEKSEEEIRKRFSIEKSYLKNQVESLKLYTSWIRPYLKAADELRQKGFEKNPALVGAFSSTMFQLTLFGKRKENLPDEFSDYNLKRDYYSCYVVDMTYRGALGQRVDQRGNYAFGLGGRIDMNMWSYALNSEEIELMHKLLEKNNLEEGLSLAEETTTLALNELRSDLDHFLEKSDDKAKKEEEEKKKEAEKKKKNDVNPIVELLRMFVPSKKEKKEEEKKNVEGVDDIEKDNSVEKIMRGNAEESAKKMLYTIYDIYKKSHGLASSPENFDN
jgi:hypothetical protein